MHHMYRFLLLFFLCRCIAESEDPLGYFCDNDPKTKGGSQTSGNIDMLLPKLVSGTVENGFIATSYGEGDARIYGLAQCRGDVSKDDCSSCIQDAATRILNYCQNKTNARIWYDFCFLRYSTVKFLGEVDVSGIYYYNIENVTDPDVFNKKLGALVDQISSEAIKPARKGLGRGQSKVSSFLTIYALVQCTRDLSDINCAQCLAIGIGNFPTFCNDKKGCRVLYSSCYVRYEIYPFFFPRDYEIQSLVDSLVKYKSVWAYKP